MRCSRQNRVQRVLAVRVTSPYTTRPTPRSFPFRTAIATDAPNSGDRTANHFAVFVPQPFRVIDKLAVGNLTKCALIQTSLRFVCRAVCDAQKTEKRREFSGQDVQLYNRARTAIRLPPGQGCAPTPRQRLTAREKFRVPLTVPELVKQKIAGPRASGVGSDFVIDDGTRENTGDGGWCHGVRPTTCKTVFVVHKIGVKVCG